MNPVAPLRFFLAGIMQGSHRGAVLHEQDYRPRLAGLLREYFPGAEIYDPLADHGASLGYDDDTARMVFYRHNAMCREIDVLLAFVPEASMGTAIEMWEAFQHGRVVLTISPLTHNWAVKFASHAVYADFPAFERELAAGYVQRTIQDVLRESAETPHAGRHSTPREVPPPAALVGPRARRQATSNPRK